MTVLVYKTGTAAVTNNSTTVTGTGTAWAIALVTSGIFSLGGVSVPIESVESDTSLTLAYAWPGSTVSGQSYAIARGVSEAVLAAWTNDRLATVITRLSLVGIHPDGSGTLTERDALDPAPATGYLWLHAEPDVAFAFYRKSDSGWHGPFPVETQGEQGPAGPTGAAGEGFNPAGAYDALTTYSEGDFVSFGTRTFVGLVDDNLGNEPPSTDADDANWMWVPTAVGPEGPQGPQGNTGATGDTGATGAAGADGSDPGVLLTFDTGTADADPGSGLVRADNADLSAATLLYVSKDNRAGSDIAAYLLAMDDSTNTVKGSLSLTDAAANLQTIWQVTGVTDATGYVKVAVANHTGQTAFADALAVSLEFSRAGDAGAGSGDVVGPASVTDGRPALFDGTTGKLLKEHSAALGTAAAKNTGTSGDAVPLLNTSNTFSADQSIVGTLIPLQMTGQTSIPTAAIMISRRARDSSGSPSAVQTNDYLGGINCYGYGATAYSSLGRAAFAFSAAENWTDAAQGTSFLVQTTAIGGTTRTTRATIQLGLAMAGATGGDKGAGTVNATAVYDDNVVLSCYVFDAALDGEIDSAKWDAKVPDRHFPEVADWVQVDTGRKTKAGEAILDIRKIVLAPTRTENRDHGDMRKFAARLGTDYDPLDIDKYTQHWKDKRHLSSLPNEEKFDPVKGMPTGAWIQRLVETVEIQAVHIAALNGRLKVLEAAK